MRVRTSCCDLPQNEQDTFWCAAVGSIGATKAHLTERSSANVRSPPGQQTTARTTGLSTGFWRRPDLRTTHIVMSPLEFMQRLAALVPRPRLHLIRFHGVLAPNAKLRREIVPSPAEQCNRARSRSRARAGRAGAHELGPAAQTGLRSPYQLHLAPAKRQVPFASPTPFIHSAGKNSTSCCTAFSGVRNASSIATRKDTGHRCLRGGRVWRQRTRTSQWERVDHGFAFKICSISQRC